MTKAELIARVATRKDLPRTLTKKAYARIIDAVFTEVRDYFIRAKPDTANPPRLKAIEVRGHSPNAAGICAAWLE